MIGPPCPSALAEAVPPAFPISPRQDQQGAWEAGQAGKKLDFLLVKMPIWREILAFEFPTHLNASSPRSWREKIPEAKAVF